MSPHAYVEPTRTVPCLNFAKFTEESSDAQAAFCRELHHVLSTVGFVKLTGHGISKDYVDRVFDWVCPSSIRNCLHVLT